MNTFILLVALNPEHFSLDANDIKGMSNIVEYHGGSLMLVDNEMEIQFMMTANNKAAIETLCTKYQIKGLLAEVVAIYDQLEVTELEK